MSCCVGPVGPLVGSVGLDDSPDGPSVGCDEGPPELTTGAVDSSLVVGAVVGAVDGPGVCGTPRPSVGFELLPGEWCRFEWPCVWWLGSAELVVRPFSV